MFIPRPRAGAPWRGTASPQLPKILTRCLGLGTLTQRLSRDRAGSQDPWLPLLGGCPLRDLIGGGRKAQAGGPEGGGLAWGRVEALGHTGQELPRHGGPSFQEKRVCPCLSYQAWVHGSVV